MTNEKEIQKRIVQLLTGNGFSVISSETVEGFRKPAMFVSVYPASVTLEFTAMEHVVDTVELKYIPAVETTEECADTAQKLRSIFMYKPFEVGDRKLTIQEIEFDIEKYILYAYFDLDYYQETPDNTEEYEKMTDLKIGGNI